MITLKHLVQTTVSIFCLMLVGTTVGAIGVFRFEPEVVESAVFDRPMQVVHQLEVMELRLPNLSPTKKGLDIERLIDAMTIVESEGSGGVWAVGDGGKSFGCLQIQELALTDVNRYWGTNYRHEEILGNAELSRAVCRAYFEIWGDGSPTYEELARIWNGGPNGMEKTSTKKYWRKVRQHLN